MIVMQDDVFCSPCAERVIKPITSTLLPISKNDFMTVRALSSYDGTLRNLILKKNVGIRYPFKGLARLVCDRLQLKNAGVDIIVPVPSHWRRTWYRGFNQAQILAKEYARLTGGEAFFGVRRVRSTSYQTHLDKEARKKNVQDAFEFKERYREQLVQKITGKHVVIVDDIMTTGATLREVGKIIAHFKPAKITALVVCRVV